MITASVNHATLARWQQELRDLAGNSNLVGVVAAQRLRRIADEMDAAMAPEVARHDYVAGSRHPGTEPRPLCGICGHSFREHAAIAPEVPKPSELSVTYGNFVESVRRAQEDVEAIIHDARAVAQRDERGLWIGAKAENLYHRLTNWVVMWEGAR